MLRKAAVCLTGVAIALASFATCGMAAAATSGSARSAAHVRPGALMIRPAGGVARSQSGDIRPGPPIGRRRGQAFSVNWSGYVVSRGHYRRVSAWWTEPAAACSGDRWQFASFWVGLDGLKSATVEQIGTEVNCHGNAPAYSAWYEMYPGRPMYFANSLRPGDRVSASVEYRGRGGYVLSVRDVTRRWKHVVHAFLRGAARSSAEVIAEAPSSTGGVLPLTDFGAVRFTGATVNGSAIGGYHPTRLTMVSRNGLPQDLVSALAGGRDFAVAWRGRTQRR